MLRHTSIHTYNIPEETNPLSGYVLCVWSEHGRTRFLNTPGGTQRECRQPLFSTLQHSAHKHSCPSHGPFVPYHCVGVPVMDIVSLLWTSITDCFTQLFWQTPVPRMHSDNLAKCNSTQEKHAHACQRWIIANSLNRNLDNYPKNNTPKPLQNPW